MAVEHKISTDSAGLSAISSNLRNSAAKLDSIFTSVKNSISKVNSNLEGASADSYMASFNEFQSHFVEFKDLIDRMAKSIDETVASMTQLDTNIAGTVE